VLKMTSLVLHQNYGLLDLFNARLFFFAHASMFRSSAAQVWWLEAGILMYVSSANFTNWLPGSIVPLLTAHIKTDSGKIIANRR